MMMRKIVIALLAGIVILICACTNIFTTFSNEQSDEALLVAAKTYIDQKDFNDAIPLFPQMSTAYQTRSDVIALEASAYAGRAGLDFLTLVNNLSNIGATRVFPFLLQNFDSGTASSMADFLTAQNLMLSISSGMTGLTNDQLLELVLIAFGNMGSILSRYGDPTATGAVSAGFNPCTGIPSAAAPNDAAQEFGVSFNLAIAALTQLGTNGVNFGPSIGNVATTACGALTGVGLGAYAFCGITNAGSFTPNQILGILSLINEEQAIGIGTCPGGVAPFSIAICHC